MTQEKETQATQPAIQINLQYIKDMSFEAPDMPLSLLDIKSAPAINVNIDLKAGKTNNEQCYTVDLTLRIQATNKETKKSLFLCELVYGALTTLNVPMENREAILMVEIPHMIFPYARAIVGNIISQAGFPSLQISPVDFAGLYRQKKAQQESKK
mgnify:CR=1 FL=1